MKNITINTDDGLNSQHKQLLTICKNTVDKNEIVFISSPVGSGKTTFAINITKDFPNHIFIFLFPTISLSEQVKQRFLEIRIETSVFNSKVELQDVTHQRIILSTIDSAFTLINYFKRKNEKVIIIIDEVHVFLQNARKLFIKSVDVILKSNYPMIGFTASLPVWVSKYLFKANIVVDVIDDSYEEKLIYPIKVKSRLLRYTAECIDSNVRDGLKLIIVFLERKTDQRTLKDYILELNPKLKVTVYNRDTKEEEQEAWNDLVQNGMISENTNVAIINSVAQAGININNDDIDVVYIVGPHDPYGIVQYTGRCRKYKGAFSYLYDNNAYTLDVSLDEETIEELLKFYELQLSQHNNIGTLQLVGTFDENYTTTSDGSIIVNKSLIVSKAYSQLKEVHGDSIYKLLMVEPPFNKMVEIEYPEVVEGVGPVMANKAKALKQKKKRDAIRNKLTKLITDNKSMLSSLIYLLYEKNKGYASHSDTLNKLDNILENIDEKPLSKKTALLLKIPSKYGSAKSNRKIINNIKRLKTIVKTAKKSNVSILKLLYVIRIATTSTKCKKTCIKDMLGKRVDFFTNLQECYVFFEEVNRNHLLLSLISSIEKHQIGAVNNYYDWLSKIMSTDKQTTITSGISEKVYKFALNTKSRTVYENGERINKRELVSVNNSFTDYLKAHKLENKINTSVFVHSLI